MIEITISSKSTELSVTLETSSGRPHIMYFQKVHQSRFKLFQGRHGREREEKNMEDDNGRKRK